MLSLWQVFFGGRLFVKVGMLTSGHGDVISIIFCLDQIAIDRDNIYSIMVYPGNTNWGSITVPLTSCLTDLD